MNKQKVAILTTGLLPVPSVLGGAVESLTQNFIDENEKQKKIYLTVYSSHERAAANKARQYNMTEFRFIKTPKIIKFLDLSVYLVLKNIFKTKKAASARAMLQRVYFMQRVAKDISKNNYDKILFENAIVQIHLMGMYGNWRRYSNKIYLHAHNELSSLYGVDKHLYKTRIITVSHFVKDRLLGKLRDEHISSDNISVKVLRNAVDDQKFQAITREDASKKLRLRYSIDKKDKVILFSGRLTPEKGIDKLIRSLDLVKSRDFKVLVVGSSFFGTDIKNPFLSELSKLSKPHADKLIFTGYIDYEDMPLIYRGSDFAVLPSNCNDAAPLTVIESITSHLPLITTSRGGIPEYANKQVSVILKTDSNLEKNLAHHIDTLILEPSKLKEMRKAAREVAKSMTLQKYYEELISKMEIK